MNAKPTIFDSRDIVLVYVEKCLKEKNVSYTPEKLDDIWDEYLAKNVLILDYLKQLKKEVQSKGEIFKVKAYSNAIRAISTLQVPIISGKQARKIPGVGAKIEKKIDEIISTGKLKTVEKRTRESTDKQKVIESFLNIWGVGIKGAQQFYKRGYRSINDIKFGDLNEQQQIGLKYYNDFSQVIPRAEMDKLAKVVEKSIKSVNKNLNICVCGSYRRGALTSGDIDILVRLKHQKPSQDLLTTIVKQLENDGLVTDTLSLGVTKFMGVIKDSTGKHRRIDIRLVPSKDFPYAILYFTGPKDLNIQMRDRAIKLGYKLSEKGLFDENGTLIPAKTEKEIFEALIMTYIPPEKR